MNQQNLNDGRCRKKDHGQYRFLKFCKHENCQDRILCSYCFESQIHQTHDNYNPDLIVNISDINIQLDSYLMSEKKYLEQLEQTKKQAKYIKDNISNMFESFITNIRQRQQEQQRHVQECTHNLKKIKKNNFNQEEILEILQIIGVENNKINIDNLSENIISIENYVHDIFELEQSVQEFVKSYKMQKFKGNICEDFNKEEKLPSIDEIKNYQYSQRELDFKFDEIDALDIAKSHEVIAVAGIHQSLYLLLIFDLTYLHMNSNYEHDCKIHSLKFCQKSEYIYFGDNQGYLNIYKLDSEEICQIFDINKDKIDSILLVSFAQLITVSSGNYSIYLTDIQDNEKQAILRVGSYGFQSYCNLAYSNLNLVYPNHTSICVQNIFESEPFIKQEFFELRPRIPLQLEISKLGDQLLTCQGQEIRRWAINHEQKQLELQNFIEAYNYIQNICFVLNDQYILYEDNYEIKIVSTKQNDLIKTIQLYQKQEIKKHYVKKVANIDYICVVRNKKVLILQKSQKN